MVYFWVFVLIESLLEALAGPLINFVMDFRCEFFRGGRQKPRDFGVNHFWFQLVRGGIIQ